MSKKRGKRVREELPEYQVESVVTHRVLPNGRREFLLKWENFSAASNTWEPEEHLQCEKLLRDYWKRKEDEREEEEEEEENSSQNYGDLPIKEKKDKDGCDLGYTLEKIMGVTEDENGERNFLVKWNEENSAEFVPTSKLNVQFPQEVIAYYEAKLSFTTEA